jgi:hypothetical protein
MAEPGRGQSDQPGQDGQDQFRPGNRGAQADHDDGEAARHNQRHDKGAGPPLMASVLHSSRTTLPATLVMGW